MNNSSAFCRTRCRNRVSRSHKCADNCWPHPSRAWVRCATNWLINYNNVLDDNDRLREKIAQQEGATIAAAASVRLSQELLALNGLPTLAGINAVTAQVIGDSPSNFSQTIEINQGSESGIRVGMPVLNAAGLVGKITKVSTDRSVVMLITDPDFALSIKVVNAPRQATTTTIAKSNAAVPSPVVP